MEQIAFKQFSTVRLTTTKQYDTLSRLTSIGSAPSADSPVVFAYQYNDANQRLRVNQADGAYWLYRYDSLGQVISGKKYFQNNTPMPGQQFEYGFDDIGNRLSSKSGGDQNGVNLRSAIYTPNLLNQYSSRAVPGGLDVVGLAPVAATITVNSSTVDYRRGEYFQKLLSPVNTSVSVWQSVAVATSGVGSTSGNVYVPKTPENFSYDLDGNQTVDGRWNHTWDAENRIIRMVANSAVGPQQRIDFGYDAKGRRISKKVWNNTAGKGIPATYLRFTYDGWNLPAELDGNNTNSIVRSYIWGSDLSGSMQGAGGVGGLLMINDPTTVTTHFVTYDGNDNVAATVSGSAGTTTAAYEYGPFGEVIRSTGTISKTNPYRFSTKYQDNESDLLYYGYRYYSQSTGRWLSRDPIGEKGGINIIAFVQNEALSRIDRNGLVSMGFMKLFIHGCENACDLSKSLGYSYGDAAGIICCKGTKIVCVWDEGGSTQASHSIARKIITDCATKHEEDHLADSFCVFNCGSGFSRARTFTNVKEKECRAFKIERQCLTDSISLCKGDFKCEADVRSEKGDVENRIEINCGK